MQIPEIVDKNIEIDIPQKVRITAERAPLYLGDSEDYEAVGTLREGDDFEVAAVSAETGWYGVRVPRYLLWVAPEHCEPIKEEESEEAETV